MTRHRDINYKNADMSDEKFNKKTQSTKNSLKVLQHVI